MPAKKKPNRDARYYKVKRAMPKTSADRSGHMVRWCKKLQHWRQEKWQKVTVSGSGSAVIRVKAGSTAKRVVPVAVNPVRVVGLTQPVDQQWRNAKVPNVKPQPAKRFHQSE